MGKTIEEISGKVDDANTTENLVRTHIYKYTIVNPTGYKRTSQVSVDIPDIGQNYECIFILQHKSKSNIHSVNASIIELERLVLETNDQNKTRNATAQPNILITTKTHRKAYLALDIDALADRQLLMILTNNKTA